jgi:hypothetical protein
LIVVLLYVLVRGLANPRTRPFVIGLGIFTGLTAMFFGIVWQQRVMEPASRSVTTDRVAIQTIASAPAPPPPKSSATTEPKRPKMTLIDALGHAVVRAWTDRALAPDAEVSPQPPDWVNAAPKMQDGRYMTSVQVGPFTTRLECDRELPRALQGAVSEYAELSLGPEAAAVRLPDDVLQKLVSDLWAEVRPMEIGGGSQDMVSLHAQVVFDAPMQGRIKAEAQRLQERLLIGRRVQGAALVFGGVLGLLALAWGGLRWATRRTEAKRT